MSFALAITIFVRYMLVVLFFPFSALDKIINFKGAVGQAQQAVSSKGSATVLILVGLCVEILMPLGILSGVADRLAAFILAGYCGTTALLWKRFWEPGDFWRSGDSKGRELFWDFLKNLSLVGGFLLITFGTMSATQAHFFCDPLSSSHPYTQATVP